MIKTPLILAGFGFAVELITASPFSNLDFESANTNNVTQIVAGLPNMGGLGTAADLLPNWHLSTNSTELNRVALNAGGLLVPERVILFTRFSNVGGNYLWDGNFALRITSFADGGIPAPTYSLSQIGDVPHDAQLLMFLGRVSGGFSLLIDGIQPELVAGAKSTSQPNLMAYDISRYAGQNVELRFELRSRDFRNGDYMYLDSIRFSPIPEPGTFALITLGGAFLLAWRSGTRGKA